MSPLKNINLDIRKGELVALIGPSGCGKTTTMRMINRLIEPTSGKVYIDGQDISQLDPVELRRNIGYVIQQIGLFPHMTIAENIALVPKLKNGKNTPMKNGLTNCSSSSDWIRPHSSTATRQSSAAASSSASASSAPWPPNQTLS